MSRKAGAGRRVPLGGASLLALLLPLSACVLDPVDFGGKSCTEGDCPQGWRCDAKSKLCVADGAGDAGKSLDASVPHPDSGSAGEDAGEDAGVADAGETACLGDPECRDLGALFCDLSSYTCQPCVDDDHCGASCNACPSGQRCTGTDCVVCGSVDHCGSNCLPCSGLRPFCGVKHTCVECQANGDCKSPLAFCGPAEACVACLKDADCGAGKWCSANVCAACDVDAHCGGACLACATPAPHCLAGVCGCLLDADCGKTASCCKGQCASDGAPLLQRISPPFASYTSTPQTLTLSGESFNACAQVMVGGKLVTATVASPTKIVATLPALTLPGTWPVQVVNPGPGGGVSNPNATLIRSLGLPSEPVDVEFLPPSTVAVALINVDRVDLHDATTLADLFKPIYLTNKPTSMRGVATKLWLTVATSGELMVVANPLTSPTQSTLSLTATGSSGKDIDIDEGQSLIAVALNGAGYRTVGVTTDAMSALTTLSPFTGGLSGVALDARRGRIAFPGYNSSALAALGSPPPLLTLSMIGVGAAVDRASGKAYMGMPSAVEVFDLATCTQLTPIPVSMALHWMRFNPLSEELVGVPNGQLLSGESASYSVGMVDASSAMLAGYLGAGGSRGCGPSVDGFGTVHEGIAIDPTQNRAWVTRSCDETLELYNLNVVFVR